MCMQKETGRRKQKHHSSRYKCLQTELKLYLKFFLFKDMFYVVQLLLEYQSNKHQMRLKTMLLLKKWKKMIKI